MKVVVSYSGGKESALSLYRAILKGYTPIALITTYNIEEGRSHFHGLKESLLEAVSQAVDVPLTLIKTTGQEYEQNFEQALAALKKQGAQACVFGDIDIQAHKEWCTKRCENVGIQAIFPLWKESRKDIVNEIIDRGFVANLTIINTKYLTEDFLGQQLTKPLAEKIAATGADICGENGEYHTFVSNGPNFNKPVAFSLGERVRMGEYIMIKVISNSE